MEGVAGLEGWRWIFILEGIFTVLFGLFAFTVLPNTPAQVRTFRPEHVTQCTRRLHEDAAFPDPGRINTRNVVSAFKSVHVLLSCLVLFASGTCLFGLAYFTPSIVQSLGYSQTRTQLMTVPPFACAFFVTMLSSYLADRYAQRGISAILCNVLSLIGAAITIRARGFSARYAGLVFLITGVYSSAPSLISWIPNNSAGHVRRATAIAMGFVSTNSGGILSTWIYPRKDAPYYAVGAGVNLGMVCVMIVGCAVQMAWLWRRNGQKEKNGVEGVLRKEGLTGKSEEEVWEVLGDKHPRYRYTY
jgi:predicted MFS family arabinose efflux permease